MTEPETALGIRAIEKVQREADERRPERTRQDRLITALLAGVAVVVAMTFGIAAFSYPVLTSGSDAANATKASGELTACRAAFSVLVTEANGRLDDASRAVDLLTNEVLQAAFQHEQGVIDRDLPQIPVARALVTSRERERDQAVSTYKTAVKRSSDDPAAFLADCKAHPPI